jgi:putative nucleotidyltransferase with HDIG domain
VDFIHPEDIKATKEAAGRLRDQKEISDFAHRFIAKDGSVHWLERRSVPVGDLIYGTARDITEKKAAEEELRRLNRTLIALNRANAALVRADDEQALLLEMCEIAAASGGYELAWVGLVEPSEGVVLRPVAWAGDGAGYLDTVAFEWPDKESELPAPLAIRTGRTQIMDDVEAVEMNFPRREYLHKLGVRSVISLPLKDRDEVFGILALDSSVPGAFGPDETALLEELASGLSYGISSLRRENERKQAENDRFRAEADLRVSVEQVERGLEGTVQALASALESRDAYTAGHQRRVAELAEAIAVHLGLPDDRVRGIFLAATLHDIGKIQVPAQILSKPGPLTDVEMAIIRTHPEAGYQILKNVEFPWPIATMVLQHHERLDGSGYPDGLRGQEIPLESRILAVADAVEARTSYRPYRPARDEGEMWKELTGRLSGEFDQAVVAACRAVWPELHERQKQVADSG